MSKITPASARRTTEPCPPIHDSTNARAPKPSATAVAGLVQPLSASHPATGAATAPDAPASVNSAMPRCVRPNGGPASSRGTAVQNSENAPNRAAWYAARRWSSGVVRRSGHSEVRISPVAEAGAGAVLRKHAHQSNGERPHEESRGEEHRAPAELIGPARGLLNGGGPRRSKDKKRPPRRAIRSRQKNPARAGCQGPLRSGELRVVMAGCPRALA